MAIDERLSLHTYKGQRAAVQDLFQQYIGGEIDQKRKRQRQFKSTVLKQNQHPTVLFRD